MVQAVKNMISLVWRYLFEILIWIDQGANVIFYPLLNIVFHPAKFGSADETLSSVFGKYSDQCIWCYRVCIVLDFVLGKKHCKKSIEEDESGL